MFKVNTHPKFASTIEVILGDETPQTFGAVFIALPASEVAEFDTMTEAGTTALLVRVIHELKDLVDDDDKPLEYTEALRDKLLGLPWVRHSLFRKYMMDLAKARLGN